MAFGTAAGLNPPLLAGNIISNGVSAIVLVIVSYLFPEKVPFQWEAFKEKITTSEAMVRTSFCSILPKWFSHGRVLPACLSHPLTST